MNSQLRRLISFKMAVTAIIIISVLVLFFHLLVIIGIIPFDIVWGGKLQNRYEMFAFETLSVLINLVLIWTVMRKRAHPGDRNTLANIVLWVFVVIFALNTAGNLAAERRLEMILATPLTFILAVLCWRVAIEKPSATADN